MATGSRIRKNKHVVGQHKKQMHLLLAQHYFLRITLRQALPVTVGGKPLLVTGDGKPYRRAPLTVSGKLQL